jgi:hypothetical protein
MVNPITISEPKIFPDNEDKWVLMREHNLEAQRWLQNRNCKNSKQWFEVNCTISTYEVLIDKPRQLKQAKIKIKEQNTLFFQQMRVM